MENTQLIINENNKANLLIIAKWLKFFAILMFLMTGLMVLIALGLMIMGGSLPMLGDSGIGATVGFVGIGVIYLILAFLYVYPSLKMYRSSNDFKNALLNNQQTSLDSGFKNLMQHFRFWGIASIVIIAFYILGIIAAIGFGAYSGSKNDSASMEMTTEDSVDVESEEPISETVVTGEGDTVTRIKIQ